MISRLMVCVFVFGALSLSCASLGAEPAASSDAGYAVTTTSYWSAEEDSLKAGAPVKANSKVDNDGDEVSRLLEQYRPSPGECDEFARTPCSSASCCPQIADVWKEEDFFHLGQFFAEGWLDQGFTWNPANPNNRFNLPVTFNDRANEYQMNQLYLSLGRHVNTDGCTWDVGGRVDLLYGTDYYFTTAAGLETYSNGTDQRWNTTGPRAGGTAALYGLAMPQLYAEFYLPWRYGTTIKVGHFNTIMGYESVMSPMNFFYSHSYMMQYAEPKTHTGFLASYQYGQNFTIHGGLTRGWDSWEDSADRPGFLGGVSWNSKDKRTNINFIVCSGDEQVNGENNRTAYSLVLMQQLSNRWSYVFQYDFGVQQDGALDPQFELSRAYWYGIDQYLFYTMSDTTSLGVRAEWFRDDQNSRVLGVPISGAATGKNYYEVTFGMNWRPNSRFTLRPEVRWDWSDVTPRGDGGMYNDFLDKNQFTFATDLIFMF